MCGEVPTNVAVSFLSSQHKHVTDSTPKEQADHLVSRGETCQDETPAWVPPQVCVKSYEPYPQPRIPCAVVYKLFQSKQNCLKQFREEGGQ